MEAFAKTSGMAAAALSAAVLAVAGCGPESRIESLRDPKAAENASDKARAAQLAGNVGEARSIFEDIAVARPSDAMSRLQLGILLQDLSDDPYAALGEFRAFLRLAPGSEKEEMVRERIRRARDQIARRTIDGDSADGPSSPGSEEQARRIAQLEEELAAARNEAAAAVAERDKFRGEADKLQRELSAKDRQLDVLQNSGVVAAPRSDLSRAAEEEIERENAEAAAHAAVSPKAGPRTYKVKRGDSLWSVAQKAYGDASRTADIRAANRDRLGDSDKLVEGMILVLPY